MGLRWQGFRRVRSQVCKRIVRRLKELGLADLPFYHLYLDTHPSEWLILDSLCRVTISRFYRDRAVFDFLGAEVLPALAVLLQERGETELRCWCIGCASGEEPYTVSLIRHFLVNQRYPSIKIRVVGTDADESVIQRAVRGCYSASSLRELPKEWVAKAFTKSKEGSCLVDHIKQPVVFLVQDMRAVMPEGNFHLILCRNSVFTYFDADRQREALGRICEKLLSGGALVIGIHENLPEGAEGFRVWTGGRGVFKRVDESEQVSAGG
jgi:chemotaxis protein methyltransferase CheR